MLDILAIIGCLLITAVVAWHGGVKQERRKNNEQIHMRRRFRKYFGDSPLPKSHGTLVSK